MTTEIVAKRRAFRVGSNRHESLQWLRRTRNQAGQSTASVLARAHLDAKSVLATAQLRLAARVDFLVARWLERRATSAEVAQRLFRIRYPHSRIPKPIMAFGLLVLASRVLKGCDREAVRPERPAPTLIIKDSQGPGMAVRNCKYDSNTNVQFASSVFVIPSKTRPHSPSDGT